VPTTSKSPKQKRAKHILEDTAASIIIWTGIAYILWRILRFILWDWLYLTFKYFLFIPTKYLFYIPLIWLVGLLFPRTINDIELKIKELESYKKQIKETMKTHWDEFKKNIAIR